MTLPLRVRRRADLVIAKAQTLAVAIADYWTTRLHDLTDLAH